MRGEGGGRQSSVRQSCPSARGGWPWGAGAAGLAPLRVGLAATLPVPSGFHLLELVFDFTVSVTMVSLKLGFAEAYFVPGTLLSRARSHLPL